METKTRIFVGRGKKRTSREKSKSLQIDLHLPEDRDLRDFFAQNEQDIDSILKNKCFCITRGFSREFFDEMKNDIYLEFFRKDILAKFNPEKSSLNTYITNQIWYAIHHILDYRKARNHGEPLPPDLYAEEKIDEHVYVKEIKSTIRETIPENLRDTFDLVVKNYNNRDIAKIYGLTPQTIGLRVSKIRDKASSTLRKIL